FNRDPGLWPDHVQQTSKIIECQCHASRCWRAIRTDHVDEDCATTPRDPRARVVVDFDDEIVEVVFPPKAVPAVACRPVEWPVVAATAGIPTPGEGGADAAHWQRCRRARMAVGPPPQADEAKSAARGRAIAFEFVGADAPASEHDRERARPHGQDAS